MEELSSRTEGHWRGTSLMDGVNTVRRVGDKWWWCKRDKRNVQPERYKETQVNAISVFAREKKACSNNGWPMVLKTENRSRRRSIE